jgi:hypothetical protein
MQLLRTLYQWSDKKLANSKLYGCLLSLLIVCYTLTILGFGTHHYFLGAVAASPLAIFLIVCLCGTTKSANDRSQQY